MSTSTSTPTAPRFSGRCKGNPIGKPSPGITPRGCDFTSTDGEEYARHLRDVHGARLQSSGSLPGRGFRAAPRSEGEKLALGRPVEITYDGCEIRAQVWAEADPSLIGAGRGFAAFFAVDDSGIAYVFALDKKYPAAPMRGQHIDNRGRWLHPVTVRLAPGTVADEITLDDVVETAPEVENFETAPEKLDQPAPKIPPVVDVPAAAETSPARTPDTVPAPMPKMTRAARKQTRREIAAAMRAEGLRPEGDAWRARCAAAGLPVTGETVTA